MAKYSTNRQSPRGTRGFSGNGGSIPRGVSGFSSQGPPSRAEALRDRELDERERRIAETEKMRRYVDRYGAKYNDYVDKMDPTADDFEANLRAFDVRSKSIPGLSDKIANKQAERKEWAARNKAEADAEEARKIAEETRLKPLRDLDQKQVDGLPVVQRRAYEIAKLNGNDDEMNTILSRSYDKATKKESDAKAKLLKDAEDKSYQDQTTAVSLQATSVGNEIKVLDSTNADLKGKKEAWEVYNDQDDEAKEKKSQEGTRPMQFTEKDQVAWDIYQDKRATLQIDLDEANNAAFRRKQIINGAKVDAPMSRVTDEDKKTNSAYRDNQFAGEQLEANQQRLDNDIKRKSLNERRKKQISESLSEANKELQEWNSKALEAPEGTPFTDEELQRNTTLNNNVDDLTAKLLENEESQTSLDESIARGRKQNSDDSAMIAEYDEQRYNSLLDSSGKFVDDADESNYDAARRSYIKDNKGVNEGTYDYRRAFADGALTIKTEGDLPDRYKMDTVEEVEDDRGEGTKSAESLRGEGSKKNNVYRYPRSKSR